MLDVGEGDNFGGEVDIPMREIPVGVVQFRIDDINKTLSLGNDAIEPSIGESYHTIVIGKPDQLSTFPGEELATFKEQLSKATTPVELRLQADGTWKGAFTIADGAQVYQARLRMTPIRAQAPSSASVSGTGV